MYSLYILSTYELHDIVSVIWFTCRRYMLNNLTQVKQTKTKTYFVCHCPLVVMIVIVKQILSIIIIIIISYYQTDQKVKGRDKNNQKVDQ